MLDLTPALAAAIGSELTTLALCWRIDRADGVSSGLTAHDRPLRIDGLRYESDSGIVPSAIRTALSGDHHQMDAAGALNGRSVSEADLLRGRFDGARLNVFLVDWSALEAGVIPLATGELGDVRCSNGRFEAEMLSVLTRLDRTVPDRFSPDCRASLGDRRCGVNLRAHEEDVLVSAVEGEWLIVSPTPAVERFRYGRLRVVSGSSSGVDRAIANADGGRLLPAEPVQVAPGTRLRLRAGCDKRWETCRDRFRNTPNFRGEPNLPGSDALQHYPS
ncbi:MAG: DUF2163 domain-containing protein [Sphingomonadaceae bacterium]|nr:DUF2163 domain-containing protein [Sphingomonadaceae bacterium]